MREEIAERRYRPAVPRQQVQDVGVERQLPHRGERRQRQPDRAGEDQRAVRASHPQNRPDHTPDLPHLEVGVGHRCVHDDLGERHRLGVSAGKGQAHRRQQERVPPDPQIDLRQALL